MTRHPTCRTGSDWYDPPPSNRNEHRMAADAYYKKTLDVHLSGVRLSLRVSQHLFSSHEVDSGTKFLLRTLLSPEHLRHSKVLDVGCGYGPIGLTLKAEDPERIVHMADRDALAVEYSSRNAELNQLSSGVATYGSLGYDDVVDRDFDLITSNIPGKAGENVIRHLLLDGQFHLAPEGLMAIVVVLPLTDLVRSILAEGGVDVVLEQGAKRFTVFHYRFRTNPAQAPTTGAFERGVYSRTVASMTYRKNRWSAVTAQGLPEFDVLSYQSRLAIDAMVKLGDQKAQVGFSNPGQGHIPVIAGNSWDPDQIHLVDRDLLALRVTQANLIANGCPPGYIRSAHGVAPTIEGPTDIVAVMTRTDDTPATALLSIETAGAGLKPGGTLVLAGGSTLVSRTLPLLPAGRFKVIERAKKRGFSAAALRHS